MTPALAHIGGMWVPSGDPYFVPRLASPAGPLWDADTMNAAFDRCKQFRVALDIGAHIGTWTRQLAQRFTSVVAFEPDELNFEALSRNLGGVGNTRLLNLAVAHRTCAYSLSHEGTLNSGQGYIIPLQRHTRWVVGVKLDDLQLTEVDFVKLDVEGLEVEVIEGAENTLKHNKPVIVLEENVCAARYNHEVGDARNLLLSFGMREVARIEYATNNFDLVLTWE